MANFRTHVVGATAPSVVFAAWLADDQGLGLATSAACVVCGAAGGLLPDVDSESSISTRLIFTIVAALLAVVGAGVTYHYVDGEYRLLAPLGAALLTYLVVRYAVSELFHAVTVHRGVIHSIPMAAACGLGLFHAVSLAFPTLASLAMWPSICLSGGFIAHLLLDELYSVDLQNARLKRSFGTALKIGSRSNLPGTAALYLLDAALIAALFIDPG